MSISFVIHGDPVGKGSVRCECTRKFPRMYMPPKTVAYEQKSVAATGRMIMAGRPPLDGAIWYRAKIYLPIPKSTTKAKRAAMISGEIRPTKKPDATNVLKAVEDGFTGIVWVDDANVVGGAFQKFFSEQPRVEITVGTIGESNG